MDKKFNINEWKDTHLNGPKVLKGDKPLNESAKDIYLQDLATPLEDAMGKLKIDSLADVYTIKKFKDIVKLMKKSGEVPAEFFALKEKEQMKLISQAERYI
jgi:hypothetical protein